MPNVRTIPISFSCDTTKVELEGRFLLPEGRDRDLPIVMMLTGDGPKGTKSLSWTNLPPRLADRGIGTFLFDFRGLGYSPGDRETLTLTVGVANLGAAFEALQRQPWLDRSRVGVLASSFGANVLLLSPAIANKCKALGFKSPACFLADAYLNESGQDLFDSWRSEGFLPQLGYRFEVLLDSLRHNAYAEASRITKPVLITHGNRDAIVPVIQSKYLSACLGGPVKLEVFDGVGHGYSEEGAWERMAVLFVEWFASHLS